MEELPSEIKYREDWRDADIGDWILADDGNIIQILRKGSMLNQGRYRLNYVGTCCGTYTCSPSTRIDTVRRRNIYSISGKKTPLEVVSDRKKATTKEVLFAKYISLGLSPQEAYVKAYGTRSNKYANVKAFKLLKTERVMTAITEQVEGTMEELGIDAKYLLQGVKEVVDETSNDRDKLSALQMLFNVAGLGKQDKTTQITGALFQGFENKHIEQAKRSNLKEITNGKSK